MTSYVPPVYGEISSFSCHPLYFSLRNPGELCFLMYLHVRRIHTAPLPHPRATPIPMLCLPCWHILRARYDQKQINGGRIDLVGYLDMAMGKINTRVNINWRRYGRKVENVLSAPGSFGGPPTGNCTFLGEIRVTSHRFLVSLIEELNKTRSLMTMSIERKITWKETSKSLWLPGRGKQLLAVAKELHGRRRGRTAS